jgi:hypothetical protein
MLETILFTQLAAQQRTFRNALGLRWRESGLNLMLMLCCAASSSASFISRLKGLMLVVLLLCLSGP